MKRICYLAISVLLLAACSKDQKEATPRPPVNNTIYGQWNLVATSQPFSQDTTWNYIKRAEDMISLDLYGNNSYVSHRYPDKRIMGTFTVSDSTGTNIKKITLSNEGEPIVLYLQLFDSGILKVDDEAVKNGAAGYESKRFGRYVECTVIL